MSTKTIKIDYLARVEGEGGLYIRVQDDHVRDVQLKIFEPPRFFEAFLRGRKFYEVPDITARICGICAVAYQMSSAHAMEHACGITVDGQLRALRRLLCCGEWIESHVLHIYLLHAPDFLGYQDAIQMAKDYPDVVKRGLRLKKLGNALTKMLGGREIHPINVKVGGFYRVPTRDELRSLVPELEWARRAALETVYWTSTLPFPQFERDYEFVALRHPDEYPFDEGRLASNKGLNIDISEFNDYFIEEHVERSTALHSKTKQDDTYLVGPLARYNLNFDKLPSKVQAIARDIGFEPEVNNPFKSIVVRGIETLYACDEALRIIEQYEMPDKPFVEVKPRAGVGYGCTEAPRGILHHRYAIDADGVIQEAQIVPPTSQNQKMIENDVWHFVETALDLPDDQLTWQCEQVIRNYDPCISCATHSFKLEIERE